MHTNHIAIWHPCDPSVWGPRWHPRYGWGRIIGHTEWMGEIREFRIDFETVGERVCYPRETRTSLPDADVISIPTPPLDARRVGRVRVVA